MNTLESLSKPDEHPAKKRSTLWAVGFFSAAITAIHVAPHKTPYEVGVKIEQLLYGEFCGDISTHDFDSGVRHKIGELAQEVPEIQRLLLEIEKTPGITVQFYNKEGILKLFHEDGMPPKIAERSIADCYAKTFIPCRTASSEKEPQEVKPIIIYLSEYPLSRRDHFIEGCLNELLGILLDIRMPRILQKQKRTPGIDGRLDISGGDIDGIRIEFTKECISGLVSKVRLEQLTKNISSYSLSSLRRNLEEGKFHDTDPPGYAVGYLGRILRGHGFPIGDSNPELYRFYMYLITRYGGDIEKITRSTCQELGIPTST